MSKFNDFTSQKFGMLTAFEKIGRDRQGKAIWMCKCECGNTANVSSSNLKSGNTKSCGCYAITHGHAISGKTLTYRSWDTMIQRCTNTNSPAYDWYGGKGVSVHQAWVESFDEFFKYMGPRPSKDHSIDRKESSGNYEPGNVRWATRTEQARNKGMFCTNTSGITGVTKFRNKWQASIHDGKKIHIGTFETLEEATKARKDAEIKYWNKSS